MSIIEYGEQASGSRNNQSLNSPQPPAALIAAKLAEALHSSDIRLVYVALRYAPDVAARFGSKPAQADMLESQVFDLFVKADNK